MAKEARAIIFQFEDANDDGGIMVPREDNEDIGASGMGDDDNNGAALGVSGDDDDSIDIGASFLSHPLHES